MQAGKEFKLFDKAEHEAVADAQKVIAVWNVRQADGRGFYPRSRRDRGAGARASPA